jgi:tRNA-2-methylthio-N6-dimethylallyladenosine synthase
MSLSTFFVKSYGCQMNIYDSEKITSILENKGLKLNKYAEDADLIVFNTCKNKSIDIILGPQSYHLLPQMIDDLKKYPKQLNTEFIVNEKFDYLSEQKRRQGVSSYITIQEGCDKFCSFCVVPYTRGPEYSRSLKSLLKEVKVLTNNGAKEIVLLGQNVNAYESINDGSKINISDLIEEISKNENVKRIRYTTSHPVNMSDDLINLHATNDKLMPFIHLPVQSGSSSILKKMNRKYDIDFYRKIIEKLKAKNPKIEISSDFIIGYPGETENDFNQTLALVDELKFTQSYSFIYSPRPGTKSSTEVDDTPIPVKKERLSVLQEKLKKIQYSFNKEFCNKTVKVLIENQSLSNPEYFFGRTPFMQSVYIKSNDLVPGHEKEIDITSCNNKSLYGIC